MGKQPTLATVFLTFIPISSPSPWTHSYFHSNLILRANRNIQTSIQFSHDTKMFDHFFRFQEIYLQGSLPAQSQLLVSDAAIVTETDSTDINSDPAVVLAGKMTLSVISLDGRSNT